MKPHIYLVKAWIDCGHRYERWACGTADSPIGYGASKKAAYLDWWARRGIA